MCLAIPGEILEIVDAGRDALATGRVAFGGAGGVIRDVCLACVPEARIGDFVLVHAGFAIAAIDEQAARDLLAELSRLSPEGAGP
ncbi:MAG TPA: HypC/HybG/HupF family hydrogenase formation chaperone [Kofleriaceae bacterium]|nr:HypC/HybG/HupF family hydrogenase formation chaperone [Kofleriaceae bacterium]